MEHLIEGTLVIGVRVHDDNGPYDNGCIYIEPEDDEAHSVCVHPTQVPELVKWLQKGAREIAARSELLAGK